MEAKRTPLIELLERVPRDAVLVVEHDQFSSSSHPVGRLCHEAAAALEAAQAERDVMREALEDIRSRMRLDPFDRLAELDNIHQIADAALAQENRNDRRG